MKEYAKKPENISRTLDSNPRASKQASTKEILQAYKNKIEGKPAQRQSIDEEELLQGKFEPSPTTQQEPIQREEKPNNTGLPDNLKTGIENLSGYSMDDVKVHYNSDKPAQLNALAYAQGTDIHVAPGQEKHLPHEAWHVVQQKQGRVQPTMQLQGVNVNDNEGLEKEADVMGNKKAIQMEQTFTQYTFNSKDFNSRINIPIEQNKHPIQLLSEIDLFDWQALITPGTSDYRNDIETYSKFHEIVELCRKCEGDVLLCDDNFNAINFKNAIEKLGQEMLENKHDIELVFKSIREFFDTDLTEENVNAVKQYNFNGPIVFTAENVIAWLRLADGKGLIDDIRYMKHELFEIGKLEESEHSHELLKADPSEEFWADQEQAHQEALLHEIDFLIIQLHNVYPQNYTTNQVAASDTERGEEFAVLFGVLDNVQPDTELAGRLTKLKQKSIKNPIGASL